MEANKPRSLHLVLPDKKYIEGGELVTTKEKGYRFCLYISEYLQAKERKIQNLMDGLEKRRKKAEAGGWTEKKIQAFKDDQATTQKKIDIINWDEDVELLDLFSDVQYIYCLAGNEVSCSAKSARDLKGINKIKFAHKLQPHVIGGGKVYLEAVSKGENPKNKPPYGVFLSGYGEPKVTNVLWTDYEGNIVSENVAPGSCLLLHIYTEDLYGQELFVQLRDCNLIVPDKDLPAEDKDELGDILKVFEYKGICEVNLHKIKPFDTRSKNGVGTLVENEEGKSEIFVQKAIVEVKISRGKIWKKEAWWNKLEVYPVIKLANGNNPLFKERNTYLQVVYNSSSSNYYPPPSNRSVVKVGQVETNIGAFRPCGYRTVTVSEGEREAVLFDQKISGATTDFELVAGNKLKEVTFKLDNNASTDDCMSFGLDRDETHEGKVFTTDESIAPSPPPAKEKNFNPATMSTEGTFEIGYNKASYEKKSKGPEPETPHIISMSDSKMTVGVNFNYGRKPYQSKLGYLLPSILNSFWLTDNTSNVYNIYLHSCRHQTQVYKLKVFPDVKWTLQVEYKNKTTEINVVSPLKKKYQEKLATKRIKTIGKRELELGLLAEYNDGDKMELTNEFRDTIENALAPLKQIVDFVEKTVLGKNESDEEFDEPTEAHREAEREAFRRAEEEQRNKTQREIDKENKAEDERLKELERRDKNIESLRKKSEDPNLTPAQRESAQRNLQSEVARAGKNNPELIRKVVGIDIEWPVLSLGFSWSRVPIDNTSSASMAHSTSMLLEGFVKADPLIKASIFLDFLALAQRSHPVVLAIIAGLDIGMQMFGKGSKIIAELRLELEIKGEVSGEINTKTGENSFNKKDSEFSEIGGSAALSLTVGIYLQMESRSVFILAGKSKIEIKAEAKVEAEAKISGKTKIGRNNEGLYFTPSWEFDGMCIQGKVKADVQLKSGNISAKRSGSSNFRYQAIPRQEAVEYGKLYFKNI